MDPRCCSCMYGPQLTQASPEELCRASVGRRAAAGADRVRMSSARTRDGVGKAGRARGHGTLRAPSDPGDVARCPADAGPIRTGRVCLRKRQEEPEDGGRRLGGQAGGWGWLRLASPLGSAAALGERVTMLSLGFAPLPPQCPESCSAPPPCCHSPALLPSALARLRGPLVGVAG